MGIWSPSSHLPCTSLLSLLKEGARRHPYLPPVVICIVRKPFANQVAKDRGCGKVYSLSNKGVGKKEESSIGRKEELEKEQRRSHRGR